MNQRQLGELLPGGAVAIDEVIGELPFRPDGGIEKEIAAHCDIQPLRGSREAEVELHEPLGAIVLQARLLLRRHLLVLRDHLLRRHAHPGDDLDILRALLHTLRERLANPLPVQEKERRGAEGDRPLRSLPGGGKLGLGLAS